jgi:hypothetical protein
MLNTTPQRDSHEQAFIDQIWGYGLPDPPDVIVDDEYPPVIPILPNSRFYCPPVKYTGRQYV